MRDKDHIGFWQAQSAEFESRARAAGTQMQTAAALAVTAVAGGLLAAGVEALQAPALAVIIAIVVWLLALICSLNWAEMKVLARKRDLANDRVAELLPATEKKVFDRIRETGAGVDRFTAVAIGAVIILGALSFSTVFVLGVGLSAGLGLIGDILRVALPALAIVTVGAALWSARARVRALERSPGTHHAGE